VTHSDPEATTDRLEQIASGFISEASRENAERLSELVRETVDSFNELNDPTCFQATMLRMYTVE
jgi:hypothetical protein